MLTCGYCVSPDILITVEGGVGRIAYDIIQCFFSKLKERETEILSLIIQLSNPDDPSKP